MNILLHSRQSFPPTPHLPTTFTSTGILLIAHETFINNIETPHTQSITAIQTLRDRVVSGGNEGKVILYQWEGTGSFYKWQNRSYRSDKGDGREAEVVVD